jgi:hypothetical protein
VSDLTTLRLKESLVSFWPIGLSGRSSSKSWGQTIISNNEEEAEPIPAANAGLRPARLTSTFGNPVLLLEDIERFAALVKRRGLSEDQKSEDRSKLAGRIRLFRDVIDAGLRSITSKEEANQ